MLTDGGKNMVLGERAPLWYEWTANSFPAPSCATTTRYITDGGGFVHVPARRPIRARPALVHVSLSAEKKKKKESL